VFRLPSRMTEEFATPEKVDIPVLAGDVLGGRLER